MTRFTAQLYDSLPRMAIDLGYSASVRSCGLCSHPGNRTPSNLALGIVCAPS